MEKQAAVLQYKILNADGRYIPYIREWDVLESDWEKWILLEDSRFVVYVGHLDLDELSLQEQIELIEGIAEHLCSIEVAAFGEL